MVPEQGRQGQSWPFLRQGPVRLGLCDASRPHPEADDPREDHRSVARSVVGRGDRRSRRASSSASRRNTGVARSAASPPRAAPTKKPTWCRSWCAPAFGNNNVDTCARVCHSPTGYGLKTTFGTSAGTQDFDIVEQADVIMVIGANPTDGHPVFASRMKRRLREGAQLIVVDPRRIDLVRTPHVAADVPSAAAARAPTSRC